MSLASARTREWAAVGRKMAFFRALLKCAATREARPLYLYWFVTEKCNLRCNHCYGKFYSTPKQELELPQLNKLLAAIVVAGVRRVTLLGGEPLLHPHIDHIVRDLVANNVSVSLLTNGVFLRKHPEVIRLVDEVGLSIDGAPSTHDRIRGVGNHALVTDAIAYCRDQRVPVIVTHTVFSENIDDLPAVMEFARQQGVLVTVNIAHGRIERHRNTPVSRASHEQSQAVVRALIDYKKRDYPLLRTSRTLEQMLAWPDYSFDTTMNPPKVGFPECQFGKRAACLSAEGVMYPCFLGTESSSGRSVLSEGFESAWQHCRSIEHCRYCHVPCFLEYNSLLALSPIMVGSVIEKLVLRALRR